MSRIKTATMLVLAAAALSGCSGVRGASDYAKRQAYQANFDQYALVPEEAGEDRVLKMFVFEDTPPKGAVLRSGYGVSFVASDY